MQVQKLVPSIFILRAVLGYRRVLVNIELLHVLHINK